MEKQKRDIRSFEESWYAKALKYAPNAAINLSAIIVIALMTVVTFSLDFNYLYSPAFIVTTFVLMVIFTLVHWSFYDGKIKGLREKEENKKFVVFQEEEIKKVTNTLEWTKTRYDFVNERNQKEKIEAHKIMVQNKLTTLKRKAKKEDKIIEMASITPFQEKYLSEKEIEEIKLEQEKARENNKYCRKKIELEEQLTDSWIALNINKINIDYNEIDPQFVETGSVIQGIKKDKQNKRGKYFKDNAKTRFQYFFLSIALSSIAAEALIGGGDAEQWALFFFRMMIIVGNIIGGLNYGIRFYEEYDLHNLNSRVSISREYKAWAYQKGIFKQA